MAKINLEEFNEAIHNLDTELSLALESCPEKHNAKDIRSKYKEKYKELLLLAFGTKNNDEIIDRIADLLYNGAAVLTGFGKLITQFNDKAIPGLNSASSHNAMLNHALSCVDSELRRRTENNKKGAQKKIENDPKQKVKLEVKGLWVLWQKDKSRYKSKSAFARDMMGKYEVLESQKVITGWCTQWEKEE